jgi:hypothetical protein
VKKIIFIFIASVFATAALSQNITLRPPTVGSTSATINGQVSGIVSSSTSFSVIYGETATNLNKTKKTNVSFGPGVLLINGFTIGTDLDSLKPLTKYFYRYVVNDALQGITNRTTVLDSFTTSKIPYQIALLNDKIDDTSKIGSFISKFSTTDVGITKYTFSTGVSNNSFFTLRNDSLFTAVKLDVLKGNATIRINSVFSDQTTKESLFTIFILDKTPPSVTLKLDTLKLNLGVNLTVNASTNDFVSNSSDNRSKATLSLSKTAFNCDNIGLNKITLSAVDDSLNTNNIFVYVLIKDTIKPSLYVVKEKSIFMDSVGIANIYSQDVEIRSKIPDSLYDRNMTARYSLDSGSNTSLVDTLNKINNVGAKYITDRFNNSKSALKFNGTSNFVDLGKDAVKVTTANPYTISLWAKLPYAPSSIPNFSQSFTQNGHRYFRSNEAVSWKRAKAICDSLGGILASPSNSSEDNFIKSIAAGVSTWIGFTDELVEGKFLNSLGDTLIYRNWKNGQPDNLNNEDYVFMDGNGLWNDASNDNLFRFIIEFDINTGVFMSKYQNLDASNSNFFVSSNSISGNGTNSLAFTTPDSNWNHYVYVLASGVNNSKVYINGRLVREGTLNYNSAHSPIPQVFLGRVSGSPPNYYNGSLDDIRVYNRALSDSQVVALNKFESTNPLDRFVQTEDNCSISQKIFSQSKFICEDLGTKSIKYSVIDKSANRVDSTILVTIKDTIKPVIKLKQSILRVDNSATFKLTFNDIDGGSFDNCSIDSRQLSKTDFSIKDTGQINVTYTISDKSGNSKATNATFTLACKDPEVPANQNFDYCQSASSTALQVKLPQGSTGSLNWFTTENGGTSTSQAPVPNTNNVGTVNYFVTHVLNGCESTKRAKITVNVKPLPQKPSISRDTAGMLISSSKTGNTWIKDGQVISDTLQILKPTGSGSYQVRNSLNGCTISSDTYYFLVTNLVSLGLNEFINVYPNPYINKVNIDYNLKGYKTLNLDIIDFSTGVKVLTRNGIYAGTPLYLGQLSGGIYILRIYSNDNKISYQFKMIKM